MAKVLGRWLLVALVLRAVTAGTLLRFHQPDEWYQTVEFARLFQLGVMSDVPEVGAHLRNLTAPELYRAPVALAEALAPGEPWPGIFCAKLATGLLDLAVVGWCLWRWLGALGVDSRRFQHFACASLLLPWFTVSEGVRASLEHLSALAMLGFVGALARRPGERPGPGASFGAGLALALVGLLRYPSGLFAAGALVAIVFSWMTRDGAAPRPAPLVAGLVAGTALGTTADALVYGRPWESFWMYLQYNVLTGLGARNFGAQSAICYLDYLWSHFGVAIALWGMPLLVFAVPEIWRRGRALDGLAWGLIFYVVGHLAPAHKEGRFMAPLLPLLTLLGVAGLWRRREAVLAFLARQPRRLVLGLLGVVLAANAVTMLEEMRGELFKARGDFLLAQRRAVADGACALLTVGELPSGYLLWRGGVPAITAAQFEIERVDAADPDKIRAAVKRWVGSYPPCQPERRLYVHTWAEAPFWPDHGCHALPLHDLAVVRWLADLAHATVLYDCPAAMVTALPGHVLWPLVRSLPPLASLPPPGLTAQELDDFLIKGGREGGSKADPAATP